MQDTDPSVVIPLTETQAAFQRWAEVDPAISPTLFQARNALWHEYCDLRDNVPSGTSSSRYASLVEAKEAIQLDMFRKARAVKP